MNSPASASAVGASVLHLRIADFLRRPVTEQAALKSALGDLLRDALEGIAAAERLVLDAPEGFAVVLLATPAAAVAVGRRLQQGSAGRPFCVGVNFGPVQVFDREGATELQGDGLATAATIAGFVPPGGLLFSDAFRRALAQSTGGTSRALLRAGGFTDANIRTHELFSLDPDADGRARRRWFILTGAGVALILLAGAAAREVRLQIEASRRPAVLVLNIEPDGLIFIDGADRGTSPPVKEVQVPAGPHRVEVRKDGSPPLRLEVNLQPGERLAVNHTFVVIPPRKPDVKPAPKPKPRPEPGFFDNVKKFFGFK